jgi:outer membrane protein OmpA-like peptidoglycan-associated protein
MFKFNKPSILIALMLFLALMVLTVMGYAPWNKPCCKPAPKVAVNSQKNTKTVPIAELLTQDKPTKSEVLKPTAAVSGTQSTPACDNTRTVTIVFASKSVAIDPLGRTVLSGLSDCLSKQKLRIVGHTDSVGDAVKKQKISQSRAESVKSYLISLGFSEQNLSLFSQSDNDPIADNSNPEGRALNRRVELIPLLQ